MGRKKKEARGRPRISEREIHLHVRLDEASDEALATLARRWDCKPAAALRRAITEAAKKGKKKK